MQPGRSFLVGLLVSGPLLVVAGAFAEECHPRGAGVMLTVASGSAANRPASGPLDQFSTHQDLNFGRARVFSADDLAALPQQSLRFVLPYDKQPHTLSGPSLQSVLDLAGEPRGGIVAHGIDGYRMEFSAAELATLQPILSLCRDGRMHGLGDLGPAFVVFKPASGTTPNDNEFARMIWGVYLIEPGKP